jgi:hypothetical protein
VSTH